MGQVLSMVTAMLLPGAAVPVPPTCATVQQAIGPARHCADTRHGLVIAASPSRAAALAALATLGEQRFELRFAQATPRYAVVEMDGQTVDRQLMGDLKRAGVIWRLPWLSEQAMADAFNSSITRGVTAKAESMHLDATQTAALVKNALAQQADKVTPAALREREAGALPHELGHGWFIHAFWPDAVVDGGGHYGGPAPDWMDETSAILMEDDALAAKRRQQFDAIRTGTDAAARAQLIDLTEFLSGTHPALPQLGPSASGSGSGVRVLTGDEAAKVLGSSVRFYLQARVFADYVLARSGNPAAFRSAARAFAGGKDVAGWLAADGARLHLPTTLAALQADWEGWLATRGT